MRLPACIGVLAVLTAGFAAAQPDVSEILKNVNDLYKGAKQYEFTVEAGFNQGGAPVIVRTFIAFKAPNRYRMDGAFPGFAIDIPDFGPMVIVHDGSAIWFYSHKENQYGSIPASAVADDGSLVDVLGELRPEIMDHLIVGRYRGDFNFAERKFLREEAIDYAGSKTDCYVVSVAQRKGGFAYTWWVDKKDYRILREDDAGASAVFTSIKINQPVSDDLFKFVPPPGAQELKIPTQN